MMSVDLREDEGKQEEKQGGGLDECQFRPAAFSVFLQLVKLELGRRACTALVREGIQGIEEKLLSRIYFSWEKEAYFDCAFRKEMSDEVVALQLEISIARLQALKGEVFRDLLKAYEDFRKEKRVRSKQGKERRYVWGSTHVHYVDFLKIEDSGNAEALTEFELKVKEKLACVPSPYDHLVRPELEAEEENRLKSLRAKLSHLVSLAEFTSLERRCYELFYLEKLSDKEISKRLNITLRRLTFIKIAIEKELKRVHAGRVRMRSLRTKMQRSRFSRKEKEVWRLRSYHRMKFSEISEKTGLPQTTCFRIFERVQKKLSSREK